MMANEPVVLIDVVSVLDIFLHQLKGFVIGSHEQFRETCVAEFAHLSPLGLTRFAMRTYLKDVWKYVAWASEVELNILLQSQTM